MADSASIFDYVLRPESADGYGAPPERWAQPWSTQTVQALTLLGALAVGFLLATALAAGRSAAVEADARKADLVALVNARQDRAEALTAQLEALRSDVAAAQSRAAAGVPALRTELAAFEAAAGLTALEGPGLRVVFIDAEGACPTGNPEDCEIQDADLQRGVNALFAAGAEGVAVNGERLIATSAIRNAGGAVLVNYRVLTSPYVVEAVGSPEGLERAFAQSQIAEDFTVWRDVYDLGFEIAEVGDVHLPAYTGSVRFRAARVPEPST